MHFSWKSFDLRSFLPRPVRRLLPLPRPTPWPKSSAPCIPAKNVNLTSQKKTSEIAYCLASKSLITSSLLSLHLTTFNTFHTSASFSSSPASHIKHIMIILKVYILAERGKERSTHKALGLLLERERERLDHRKDQRQTFSFMYV